MKKKVDYDQRQNEFPSHDILETLQSVLPESWIRWLWSIGAIKNDDLTQKYLDDFVTAILEEYGDTLSDNIFRENTTLKELDTIIMKGDK